MVGPGQIIPNILERWQPEIWLTTKESSDYPMIYGSGFSKNIQKSGGNGTQGFLNFLNHITCQSRLGRFSGLNLKQLPPTWGVSSSHQKRGLQLGEWISSRVDRTENLYQTHGFFSGFLKGPPNKMELSLNLKGAKIHQWVD